MTRKENTDNPSPGRKSSKTPARSRTFLDLEAVEDRVADEMWAERQAKKRRTKSPKD